MIASRDREAITNSDPVASPLRSFVRLFSPQPTSFPYRPRAPFPAEPAPGAASVAREYAPYQTAAATSPAETAPHPHALDAQPGCAASLQLQVARVRLQRRRGHFARFGGADRHGYRGPRAAGPLARGRAGGSCVRSLPPRSATAQHGMPRGAQLLPGAPSRSCRIETGTSTLCTSLG